MFLSLNKILIIGFVCLFCFVKNCVHSWKGHLTFNDEFSNNYLRSDNWEHDDNCEGKGNSLECFQKGKNIMVENGTLVIKARVDILDKRKDTPYTSGKIRTHGTGFSYGTFVVRARMPKGKHLRPLIWIQPVRQDVDDCRYEEIDIVEYRGQRTSTLTFSGYYGKSFTSSLARRYEKVFRGIDFSQDFHEFALRWLPTRLQWFVDGRKVYELTTHFLNDWIPEDENKLPCDHQVYPIFKKEVHLVMSLNVGGNAFNDPKYGNLTRLEALKWSKPTLDIDYVRVYQD